MNPKVVIGFLCTILILSGCGSSRSSDESDATNSAVAQAASAVDSSETNAPEQPAASLAQADDVNAKSAPLVRAVESSKASSAVPATILAATATPADATSSVNSSATTGLSNNVSEASAASVLSPSQGSDSSQTGGAQTGGAQTGGAQAVDAESLIMGIMPQRIHIPSIRLDTPVVELGWHPAQNDDGAIFSEWDVADNAAGWHENSSLLGENGNIVLSGHNNVLGAVFRELDQLKRGDEAILWVEDEPYTYFVDKVMIVPEKYASQEQREANAAWIGHFEDDRLTLVSCWPRDDNSHRIIVVAYANESELTVSN